MSVRQSALDEIGSLDAPPGSRDWAAAVRRDVQHTLNSIDGDATHLRAMIGLVRDHEGYRALENENGKRFATFRDFCVARQPFGLGCDPKDIDAIQNAKPGQTVGTVLNPKGVKSRDITSSVTTSTPIGRGADYHIAGLRRDRPDLMRWVESGELTAHAAAVKAGFIGQSIRVPDDPHKAAQRLRQRFQGQRLRQLIDELIGEDDGDLPTSEVDFDLEWRALCDRSAKLYHPLSPLLRQNFAAKLRKFPETLIQLADPDSPLNRDDDFGDEEDDS
jgi:hypothetical protein